MNKISADINLELELLSTGIINIAGADEVGRGAFAGPVVTGVVVFSEKFYRSWTITKEKLIFRINDSKKLPPKERELAAGWIKENCLNWSIGEASVNEINEQGIVNATNQAYKRALSSINSIQKLLTDAFFIPNIENIPESLQIPLIKGDSKALSIAAASIVAKVYRDNLMRDLGSILDFLPYQWHQNKGYGTLAHRNAIKEYGISSHHRTLFVD